MAIALWTGLRQLEALRSSTMVALMQGGAGGVINGNNVKSFVGWARQEGFNDDRLLDGIDPADFNSRRRFALLWHMAIDAKAENRFEEAAGFATRTTENLNVDADYGPERSSANWDRWSNFITTSSFVRLLAALEQYEIDVLNALFFYRPAGRGIPSEEYVLEDAEECVVHEVAKRKNQVDYYVMPPLWTWLLRSARDNTQRKQIFSRVYCIDLKDSPLKWSYNGLYEMRNAIAHGRARVDISIMELIEVHGYVMVAMLELADEVRAKYNLIV